MPEVDDAIPCITGSWSLLQLIGRARIADLILTGRMIDADEARSWGLVSRMFPLVSSSGKRRPWLRRSQPRARPRLR